MIISMCGLGIGCERMFSSIFSAHFQAFVSLKQKVPFNYEVKEVLAAFLAIIKDLSWAKQHF